MSKQVVIFRDDPKNTREAILRATFRALSTHGYAALNMQQIGDEFGKSKSLVYHHYDGKDEVIEDLLVFTLERIRDQVPLRDLPTAYDQLLFALKYGTGEFLLRDQKELILTLTEFRVQAIHDETFRQHFTDYSEFLKDHFKEIVVDGIEEGVFKDVDPDRVAEFLYTMVEGTIIRYATTDGVDHDGIQREVTGYVNEHLLVDDVDPADSMMNR